MAGSHPEPLHSPSELRKEAESPLNAAIRSQVQRTRKRLRAASFELIWNPAKVAQTFAAPMQWTQAGGSVS